jgi:hypothetical protein
MRRRVSIQRQRRKGVLGSVDQTDTQSLRRHVKRLPWLLDADTGEQLMNFVSLHIAVSAYERVLGDSEVRISYRRKDFELIRQQAELIGSVKKPCLCR